MKKIKYICLLTLFLMSTLFLCSCNKEDGNSAAEYSIPDDVEVIKIDCDRILYYDLENLEKSSDLIIKGKIIENLGQNVETYYDDVIKKDLPTNGWTNWEIEITEVYKGSLNIGDSIKYSQDYYLWDNGEEGTQLITSTSQEPVQIGKEYLLFLGYNSNSDRYFAKGDHEGKYSIPDDNMSKKAEANSIEQSDLDMYESGEYSYMTDLYKEVSNKYFK